MKKNRAIVLFLIFSGTVFSRPLLAQCEKAGTTADMTRCMSNEYEKADAELTRIYKLAFKGLDENETENLKKAQRAWIAYRDANVRQNTRSGMAAAEGQRPTWDVLSG